MLELGTVTNLPMPKPKYPVPPNFTQPQEMVVDITVKIGDRIVNYNGLPAHLDIADSYSNGENIVISDSREAMNSEILNFKQKSIDAINSVDMHKGIIDECDLIISCLEPLEEELGMDITLLIDKIQKHKDIASKPKGVVECVSLD